MVKHTQKILRLFPTNCLSVFDHFVELAVKELKNVKYNFHLAITWFEAGYMKLTTENCNLVNYGTMNEYEWAK